MKSVTHSLHSLTAAIAMALIAHAPSAVASDVGGMIETNASQLNQPGEAHARLAAQFDAGVPILVHMDTDDRTAVARFFGITPRLGDAIFQRGGDGAISVIHPGEPSSRWSPSWTPRLAGALASFQAQQSAVEEDDSPETGANVQLLPMQRFHEGVFDTGSEEITGRATISVFRSASRVDDDKEIHVVSWFDITPAQAGIDLGHAKQRNISAAYLPVRYEVAHEVNVPGEATTVQKWFPVSDGRTSIQYTKTDETEISVGVNLGNGASEDGQANVSLAAKIPFNATFGYTHKESQSLSYAFQDYSLAARTVNGGRRMMWEAPISPRLTNVLIDGVRADSVDLTEKRMTPMMRTAHMPAWSVWEVNGASEATARVTVTGGYTLQEHKWWWNGPEWVSSGPDERRVTAEASFDLDLSSPYLTREITVLLRSSADGGQCIAQRGSDAVMATCDPRDRAQMWGLTPERNYVNRSTGDCLEADIGKRRVGVSACSFRTAHGWQWRADRIHSEEGESRHRLYVEDGELKVVVEPGQFDDIPENPHNPLLKPWAGYPRAPLEGELQPAPFRTQAGTIPAGWAGIYGATSASQRWTPIVLRVGLGEEG
ncbi:RICIN domain-containing protein [Luteibacter pinisoli]|uniref:RICIN domain-containing protein n=1 Tax=Luteibacter pinisoli TaxID=2589080 RepID=A0A4Y5Z2F7_9GAMM|nr:RICIN domain-containing protein [Luteibacter pinisoli]QDE39066.1 RICIN domain-containing protein [Luteibacter pinisoli]